MRILSVSAVAFRNAWLWAALVLVPGCYEGWEDKDKDSKGPSGPGPGGPAEPLVTPIPPYAYILFEPIILDARAIDNAACFPATGLRMFRKNEWTARLEGAKAALPGLADKFILAEKRITIADCRTLQSVTATATNTEPWLPGEAPPVETKDRPVLHLKMILWNGDLNLPANDKVYAEDWLAWSGFKKGGMRALSLHYFVLENAESGFFAAWRDALGDHTKLSGTPIDAIDPTPAGLEARTKTVTDDNAAFIAWVSQSAAAATVEPPSETPSEPEE